MYGVLLAIHNLLRWFVLLAGVLALLRAVVGLLAKRPWSQADRRAGMFYTISLDLQFLAGLILTFTSPLVRAALANLSAALSMSDLRFFPFEHIPFMVLAVFLAHAGSSQARKAKEASGQHRRAALWYGLSLLVILVAIPWWRPLLRGL
jgi:CDP-diglyceride synthetase